jgi:hypothetical protein
MDVNGPKSQFNSTDPNFGATNDLSVYLVGQSVLLHFLPIRVQKLPALSPWLSDTGVTPA